MVAYTKPQLRKKEESERLRGESGQIKLIDLRFERWQVVITRKVHSIKSNYKSLFTIITN